MSLPTNRRFRYYALYWPFRWPLFYCMAFALALFFYLRSEAGIASYANDVMQLGGKMILAFLVFLPLLSLLTLIGSILFFLFQKNNLAIAWRHNRLEVNRMVQPLMGFVRVHLLHQKEVCSELVLLLPTSKSGFIFLSGAMDSAALQAADVVRAETMDGLVFHFEDPFRFFSISFFKSVALERLQLPDAPAENTDWLYSKHPEREEEHTPHMQRRAGDWLHLKSFEPGDDVRRIVWTLYARHKALMVRWQDQQDPYGDTLRAYVSFNAMDSIHIDPHLFGYAETQYKQRLFAILKGFLQEGVLLDWRTDYVPWVKGISLDVLAGELTRATWHANNPPLQNTDLPSPSLVFVSSVDTPQQVEQMAACWPDALFVHINLFQPLTKRSWRSRLKSLLFKPNPILNTSLYNTWWRHPLRARIMKNENHIKELLQQSTKEGGLYV